MSGRPAGRLSERAEWVEQAFRDTYASIKPNDGVIIGMYLPIFTLAGNVK